MVPADVTPAVGDGFDGRVGGHGAGEEPEHPAASLMSPWLPAGPWAPHRGGEPKDGL